MPFQNGNYRLIGRIVPSHNLYNNISHRLHINPSYNPYVNPSHNRGRVFRLRSCKALRYTNPGLGFESGSHLCPLDVPITKVRQDPDSHTYLTRSDTIHTNYNMLTYQLAKCRFEPESPKFIADHDNF